MAYLRDDVRVKLYRNNLSQVWLIGQLERRGVAVDKSELSSILKGSRKGKKADLIVSQSAEILTDYETRMEAD